MSGSLTERRDEELLARTEIDQLRAELVAAKREIDRLRAIATGALDGWKRHVTWGDVTDSAHLDDDRRAVVRLHAALAAGTDGK